MALRRTDSYRRNTLALIERLVRPYAPVRRALDFGSGEGWFAREMVGTGLAGEVVPVDVMRREQQLVEPIIYDGQTLPFSDRAFDLTYAVDVLHHCPDPHAALTEALRCTSEMFVVKDHTYRTLAGRVTLAIFDELGNHRFGVPSLYRYQRRWEWSECLEASGFRLESCFHPAPCHDGALGRMTNHLQFVSLWRRFR